MFYRQVTATSNGYNGTYNHLIVFATELRGLWEFVPLPGYRDKETGEIIQPELHPEDVKDKILDIITSLTKAKDVIDIQYNKDFLSIYESKQEKSTTQLVKRLVKRAEKSNNQEFIKEAKEIAKQVSHLTQAKDEAEKESDQKRQEKYY